jgi:hypothetical protein
MMAIAVPPRCRCRQPYIVEKGKPLLTLVK